MLIDSRIGLRGRSLNVGRLGWTRGRRGRLLLTIVFVLVATLLPDTPAFATHCNKYEFFDYDFLTGYGVHGTRAVHQVRAHSLDLGCADAFTHKTRFWSTAHIRNQDWNYWVEVGWVQRNGTPQYETFVEWGSPFGATHIRGPAVACCQWSVSKVSYLTSDSKWHFQFDYGNDGSFFNVYPPTSIGWTTGYTYSETGLCCHTLDPYDHFIDLMRTTDGLGTLAFWQNNIPDHSIGEDIPGREWRWLSNAAWDLPES